MGRNKEDVYKLLGASNHCKDEREKNDFYSTDPECVRDLLTVENFSKTILEPCCGTGNISKVLEEAGYTVISTDLINRGYGTGGVDFFERYATIDYDIVSNPPYGLATEFVEHALNVMKPHHKMALFLKLQFLEGADRYTKIFKQNHLETVYVYSKRVACYKNDERYQTNEDGSYKLDKSGNKMKIGSAVCFVWAVFNNDYNGFPTIKWLNTPEEIADEIKPVSLF